jgi:hypothetical protein
MSLSGVLLQILDCETTPFTSEQIAKFSVILKLEQGSEKAALLRALNPMEKSCFTKEFIPYFQLCQNIQECEQGLAAIDKQLAMLDTIAPANSTSKVGLGK